MVSDKKPDCLSCGAHFEDWKDLALHISTSRKGHQKGKKWAASILMKVNSRPEIKRAAPDPDHVNTVFGDENRERAKREISGETTYVNTHCPVCNNGSRMLLPVEFTEDRDAWRNSQGLIMTSCQGCSR